MAVAASVVTNARSPNLAVKNLDTSRLPNAWKKKSG
jgi:hypothetical protein